VGNTAELSGIKLLHTEKIRGQTRLHFIAGQRLFELAEGQLRRERALNDLLKAGPEDHAELISRAQTNAKLSRRVISSLLDEVAASTAARLFASDAPLLVHHHELGQTSREFLQKLQRALRELDPTRPLLLTGRDEGGAPGGTFSLSATPDFVDAVRSSVLEHLDAKGGGRPGQLQGKAARLDQQARNALATHLLNTIAKAD
jgi:alanyl-tRNA synthetase